MKYSSFLQKLLWLLAGLLCACTTKPVDEAQLKAYLADPAHGLLKEVQLGAATVQLSYRPTDILLVQDIDSETVTNSFVVDSLRREYAKKHYFLLQLSKNQQSLEAEAVATGGQYERLLSYLNGGIVQDVWLACEGDTIPALGHVYSNFYNTTGTTSLLFAFENTKGKQDVPLHFIFKGEQLGLGVHSFTFKAADLAATPKLRL